jgi:hypothetical protein
MGFFEGLVGVVRKQRIGIAGQEHLDYASFVEVRIHIWDIIFCRIGKHLRRAVHPRNLRAEAYRGIRKSDRSALRQAGQQHVPTQGLTARVHCAIESPGKTLCWWYRISLTSCIVVRLPRSSHDRGASVDNTVPPHSSQDMGGWSGRRPRKLKFKHLLGAYNAALICCRLRRIGEIFGRLHFHPYPSARGIPVKPGAQRLVDLYA